jgi:hypothetical protein
MLRRPLALALGLGIATSVLVGAANYLPYSPTRDAVTDALSLPGGFIVSLVYPEGVHTGYGAPNWGLAAAASNLAVYVLLWYVCLRVVRHFRRKDKTGVQPTA